MTDHDPLPKRRRFQFRLRTLFALVLVISLPVAWLAHERRAIAERRTALEQMGARLDDIRPQPTWRLWLFGDDLPSCAGKIILGGDQVTDAGLCHLKGLTQLRELQLNSTQVTDAGLVCLKGLTELRSLSIEPAQVTDAGLLHLKGLSQLRFLLLRETQVTDAGLVHFKELPQLQAVWLFGTKTTDAGLGELRKVLPNTTIYGHY